MRALGRDGWLLCRWPLEESIHAESDADDSSAWVRSTERGNFPPIREVNERTKEETKA